MKAKRWEKKGWQSGKRTGVRAEWLESRLFLSHSAPVAPGHSDPATIRAILAQPIEKATFAQLAQVAELGLVPTTWMGRQIFAEKDQWVVSIVTGRGKLNRQVKAAQQKVGSLLRIDKHLGKQNLFLATAPANARSSKLLASLQAIPGFAFAEPNAIVGIGSVPNDPEFSKQWSLNNTGQTGGTNDADIDAPEAWDTTIGSPNVIVGLIDTGVDISHPDLAANIWTNPLEIPGDGIDNDANGYVDDVHGWDFYNADNDPFDDNGHGTHVAGIVAASGNNNLGIAGVSQRAKILAIKAFGPDGFGLTADCVNAVNYATALKVRGENVRVINNSWGGGGYSQALHDAIAASGNASMLFVAAAGNYSTDTDAAPFYPASYDLPNIISVAATDQNDQLAVFSNFGKTSVDLAAPGSDIYSTVPGGGYDFKTGTSMAAAHVAGTVALLWGYAPETTPAVLKQAILSGVDVNPTLTDKVVSNGRLNTQKVFGGLGMLVTGSIPAPGAVISTNNLSEWRVTFSAPINSASLSAADLKVNGKTPSFAAVTGPQQASFSFNTAPLTTSGTQTISMAANSVTSVGGLPLIAWTSNFYYDPTPLTVQSTTPTNASAASVPLTSIRVKFSEAIDLSSVAASDLLLSQGTVTGITNVDSSTVQFNLSGITQEGALTLTIPAGAVKDVAGNPSQAYSGSLTLDAGANAIPISFSPLNPAGSLVYEAVASGTLSSLGDSDAFEFTVPAGQLLSVAIEPTPGTLRPAVTLRNPAGVTLGTATAASAGKTAFIAAFVVPAAGTYRIIATSAAGSGAYTVRATLNADLEREPLTSVDNGSMSSAQSLDASFDFPTAANSAGSKIARAAVRGKMPFSIESDFYSITLSAGQTLSAMMWASQNVDEGMSLLNSSGQVIATATFDADRNVFQTPQITAATAGLYYCKVTTGGANNVDYTLAVTRDALVEKEPNDTASATGAQSLAETVIGSIGQQSFSRLLAADTFDHGLDSHWTTYTSVPGRGKVRVEGVSADAVGGGLVLSIDLLSGAGPYTLNEAIWTLDLSGATSPVMTFAHASYNDDLHPFQPGEFTGHVNADGIMISDDGVKWHPVWTPPQVDPYRWTYVSVDLAAEAARYGLAFGKNFKIKFQQYGNQPEVDDGRGFDDIRILDRQADSDVYTYAGVAGQALDVSVSAITSGGGLNGSNLLDPVLSLYDGSGNLLGYDYQGASAHIAEIFKVLPYTGNYTVVVRSTAAGGEYLLRTSNGQNNGQLLPPDLLDASDTGVISADNITNLDNSAPGKSLQLSIHGVTPDSAVKLYADGTLIGQGAADDAGSDLLITTDGATVLSDGLHQITFTQTPAGGDESAPSRALTIVIDTTSPGSTAGPTLRATSDTGPSKSDGITNDTTPTLTIPTQPGTLYQVFRNGVAEPGGLKSTPLYTPLDELPDGTYSYQIALADLAGNLGALSGPLQITIDTVAPGVPPAPALDVASDTGKSNSDLLTKDNTPTINFSGTAYFQIRVDGVDITTGPFSGSYTPPKALADGAHTFTVAAVDAAGNASDFGPPLTVTIDTVSQASSLAGDLDPNFATTGAIVTDFSTADEEGDAVAVQSDGKILFAGYYWNGSGHGVYVERLLPNGALDPSFGTNGKSTFVVPNSNENTVRSISVLSDGKILIGGDLNTNTSGGAIIRDMYVARLTAAGALDNTFNALGKITLGSTSQNEYANSMTVAPDGKIWIAGKWEYTPAIGIATSDGFGYAGAGFSQGFKILSQPSANATLFTPSIRQLAVGPDNKMYAVGTNAYPDDPGATDLFLTRFTLDGVTDFSFGTNGFLRLATPGLGENAAGIAVRPDGKIVIAYGVNGRIGALRLLPTGDLDPSFGISGRTLVPAATDNGSDYISNMVIQADGKIVLAGNHQTSFNPDFLAARLLADGSVDSSFGSGGRHSIKVGVSTSDVRGLAVQSDNNILLTGAASASSTDNSSSALVRLSSVTSLLLDLNTASDSGASNSDNYTNDSTPDFTLATSGQYNLYRDGVLIRGYSTATAFTDTPQADGVHTYSLSLADDAGNESAPFILKVTVDTLPDVVTPDLVALSDTGLTDTDNITSDNTPDFNFPGVSQYRLYRNGVEITSGYTTGLYTAPTQADGTWNYTAQTIDLAGNIAPAGAALTVTIDTVAPQAPVIPDLDPANDTGISSTDNITSSQTLNFLPLAAGAPYIRLYRNGTVISGNYYAANTAFLSNTGNVSGIYTFAAAAVDVAGNLSPLSPALSVNVDTFSPTLSGQAASWDNAFDKSDPAYPVGVNETLFIRDHAVLSDGKILVAGLLWNTQTGIGKVALIRLLPSGAPDLTFGVNGQTILSNTASENTFIYRLIALPDGRVVGAGRFGIGNDYGPALMRFTAAGALDTTFGAGGIARVAGITRGEALDFARQSDGKFVLTGYRYANQYSDSVTARFSADGAPDPTFGAGGAIIQSYSDTNDQLNAVLIQPDGKVVVGGAFEFINPNNQPPYATGLIRYNANGTLDTDFGTAGMALHPDFVYNLLSDAALLSDGSIATAGYLTFGAVSNRAVLLMKFDSHGVPVSSFGNGGVVKDVLSSSSSYNPRADLLTVLPGDKLLVGGSLTGDSDNEIILRYNANGSRDATFASNGIFTVAQGRMYGLSVDSSNRILTTGNFVASDGPLVAARYLTDALPAVDLLPASDNGISQTDNLTNDTTPDIAVVKSDLYYRVYDGGTLISGLWETADVFTPAVPLSNGAHVLTLRSVDSAGNLSAVNPALTITIQSLAQGLDLDSASDTGISNSDNITADNTPTFNFPGVRYRIYLNGQPMTANFVTGPVTLDALPDGLFSVTVDAVDDAGNTLNSAAAFDLTIDTTKPAPSDPLDLLASSDTGISNSDDLTKDNTPSFAFTPAPHVRIYRNGVFLADLTDGAGSYTAPVQPDGSAAFTLTQIDAAGNESAPSTPMVVHIDTVAPSVIQPVLISQNTTDDAGELVTNDDTPSIDLPGLYYFLNINGIQANSGVESGPYEVTHLGDGLHHLTALTFDAAGNQTPSTELLVRIDTVPPKVLSADFLRDGGPMRIRIAFDDDVSRSLTADDLLLHNQTTDQDIAGATLAYDPQTNVATWTFPDLPGGQLPEGDYIATLFTNGVTDFAANPVDGDRNGSAGGDLQFSFFHLRGDVNLDRSVGFADLVTIAQGYGSAAQGWTHGDLNGDGQIGFADLVEIAQNYGKSLDSPPVASPAPAPLPVASANALLLPANSAFASKPVTKSIKPIAAPKPASHTKPTFARTRIRL